ncbi:hypothetical protein Tco_0105416 [Tanacetum coccineum]
MATLIAGLIALDDSLWSLNTLLQLSTYALNKNQPTIYPVDRTQDWKMQSSIEIGYHIPENTLQVVYDVLKLTRSTGFPVTADAPEIYMQEFWAYAYVHNRSGSAFMHE